MYYFGRPFIVLSLTRVLSHLSRFLRNYTLKSIPTMKNYFFLCLSILALSNVYAQVGIGTVSPLSTLDVRGSFSGGTRVFTGTTSASSTDYILVFTGSSAS